MPLPTFELELVEHREEVPNVRRFVFRRVDGEALSFVPGQFLMLHYDDGEPFKRSYSLSSVVEEGEGIEMVVSFVEDGRGCAVLFGMEPGDRVEATGPYGRFTLRGDDPQRYIFVGTGTGVAPYRTMVPSLEKKLDEGVEVILVEGVRTAAELLFRESFTALGARENAAFHACYSREEPPTGEENARRGYVTQTLADLEPTPERDIVYLCGNPAMVDDAVALLKERGFPPRSIRREKYIS